MSGDPFTPEVVGAILRHMNDDHAADTLLIVRALGGQPSAAQARMTGVDTDGANFTAVVDGEAFAVRLAWSQHLTERSQVRSEVVRMYREACQRLGVSARKTGSH